jgi:signal transduction histidine kinase
MAEEDAREAAATAGVEQQGAEYARESDLSWVAAALLACRESILDNWLAATTEQPFHHGRRDHAVADHIPVLFDAVVALLERAAPRWVEPGVPLDDEAVREAAEAHARMRVAQGLAPTDISTEFRLLRQELWRALREQLPERAPIGDTIGAQILLNDALDGAMALGLAALTAQIEQTREEFLATTVHEVRRPLTVIRGNAGLSRRLLARPTPNVQQIDTLLTRIELATEQMNDLLTRLIELSQATLGGIELHLTSGDLAAIIQDASAQFGPDVARVQLQVWSGLDTTGHWDVERLAQVFSNLIANALKYSPAATPIVVTLEGDATTLSCRVTDQGIGIPADDLPRLFTRYGRGSNAISEGIDGVGLGLYLCRALVEAHGGQIWAASAGEGRGTTMHVVLPRAAAPHSPSQPPGGHPALR